MLAASQEVFFYSLSELLDDLFMKFTLMIRKILFLTLLLVTASIADTPEAKV